MIKRFFYLLLVLLSSSSFAEENIIVILHTSAGDITMELYPDKAPVSVENFLAYANSGFYDGTIFHRVEKRFVIQGGGFTEKLEKKKPATRLSMSRTTACIMTAGL